MEPRNRGRTLDGRWAEQRALRLLQGQGWRCLAQRWRCRYGEIDLLMVKGRSCRMRLLAVEANAPCFIQGTKGVSARQAQALGAAPLQPTARSDTTTTKH